MAWSASDIQQIITGSVDSGLDIYYATHPEAAAQVRASQTSIGLTPLGVQAQIGTNTVIILAIAALAAVLIFSK